MESGTKLPIRLVNWESTVDLSDELRLIREFDVEVITAESPKYPRQLREIHAPPIVLYVWGELTERDQHANRRHRFATHHSLRVGMREETFLPARLRGI